MNIVKIKSTFKFNKGIAKRLCNTKYYQAQTKDQRMAEYIDKEKLRLSTPPWERITDLIEMYKNLAYSEKSSTGKVLLGIYNKNYLAAKEKTVATNSKLLSILCKTETLLLAYQQIKGNRGALTPASEISAQDYGNLNSDQKSLYLKSLTFPDNISLYDFILTSQLLAKQKYPWGTSLRVYIPKPGVLDKMRPLTIPPFMDRIVQKAINMILESIYEPYFESTNRSFAFRPNKGTLDAMTALLSTKTSGMKTAIEGDIEAAYDTVKKQKLIEILEKRIKDKKFIKLLITRLDYEYMDSLTNKRVTPEDGIPQGGIDSPYLWNIYMMEFDNFIETELTKTVEELNQKLNGTRSFNRNYNSIRANAKKLKRELIKEKKNLTILPTDSKNNSVINSRKKLYTIVKKIRLNNNQKNGVSSSSPNKKILRIFYVRYADDWILLTNGSLEIAQIFKSKIATFLLDNLGLKLSEKKTIITNIAKTPAHFLGFEIRCSERGPLRRLPIEDQNSKKKFILCKKAVVTLWCQPDRQRLINKYHMKGLCDKNGFPLGQPWMSCLEPQTIIERCNAVLRGMTNFYLPVIRNRAKIHRWIYIIRFSCLKTLAQKYRCSIKKIFKKYGADMFSKATQTVRFKVTQKYQTDTYTKEWKLLSYNSLIKDNTSLTQRKSLLKRFWDCEKGLIGQYPNKIGSFPKITNSDFLTPLTWVSWRTSANFNMPCAYCGRFDKVHMHHIKHIRKTSYSLIPEPESYKQIMALRNRRQIPLCEEHHLKYVHSGRYNGPSLIKLLPNNKLIDNRIIHLSSFIKPGKIYTAKSLIEKGWSIDN